MSKYFKIFLVLILTLAGVFALFQRAALANFVQNAWQGYKLTEGLIGYWSFDGKDIDLSLATAEVRERSGQSNHGDWRSHATTTTIGKIGQAIDFDGVDDSINLGDVAVVDAAAALSSCAWVKHDVLTSDDGIIAKITAGAADGFVFFRDDNDLASGRTDTYTIFIADSTDASSANLAGATDASRADTWTHVCFTFEISATGLRLYINGVEDANSPVSTTGIAAIDGGSQALEIGNNSLSALFDGAIDETRIYTRVLSADEVKRLYLMGASFKTNVSHRDELTEGLLGEWTFDGKDMVENVVDVSGQGNNGMLAGQTSTTTTIGKIGQAITLDGVDDFVNIPTQINGMRTIAFWMNGTSTPSAKIIDLAGGSSENIESINGTITANNFTVPTIYVDGVVASAVTAGWHHVVVTTGTGINGSPVTLGKIASGFFTGSLDEIRIYDRALSADEAKRLYLMGASLKTNVSHRDELTEGLVGYWTFDGKDIDIGSSTKEVLDVSVQGNNGNWSNHATTTTIGKIGQAITFDGVDDYVSVANSASLNIGTSDVTFSAWIKPVNETGSTRRGIIGKRNSLSPFQQYSFSQGHVDSGGTGVASKKIGFFFFNGGPFNTTNVQSGYTTNDVVDGNWHFVQCVRQNGSSVKMYVDGVSVPVTYVFDGTTNVNGDTTESAYIGTVIPSSGFWKGNIDEIRMYNRALSPDEAKRLYLMGK